MLFRGQSATHRQIGKRGEEMEQILYESTRGSGERVSSSRAILKGLAEDGGLYVPDHFPTIDFPLDALSGMHYKETAFAILRLFLTDYTEDELKACIDHAYDQKFDTDTIAPLHLAGDAWYLELFHGATIAFKDMALSILPHLMTTAAKKQQQKEKIVILTATSGDTGKAAMAGFADVPGTEIIVFYPKDGVSPVQKLQMTTQKGRNTHVVALHGNFDEAQSGVKDLFNSRRLKAELKDAGFVFSSANSINIGRLIPQVAYYFYAYGSLLRKKAISPGDSISITVPTGNFGNILAAYYAGRIGLPVHRLICASNENKVLYDFFQTGVYDRNRPFLLTSSPSMDILISSNLERLLYFATGRNAAKTAGWMEELSLAGKYEIPKDLRSFFHGFYGGYASEEKVFAAIHACYEEEHYLLDPHTAVAAAVLKDYRKETGDEHVQLVASTASPYKFARSVLHAVDSSYDQRSDPEQFRILEKLSGVPIPKAIRELENAQVLHTKEADRSEMETVVRSFLGI